MLLVGHEKYGGDNYRGPDYHPHSQTQNFQHNLVIVRGMPMLQPKGEQFQIRKPTYFFAKLLSKIACQAPTLPIKRESPITTHLFAQRKVGRNTPSKE